MSMLYKKTQFGTLACVILAVIALGILPIVLRSRSPLILDVFIELLFLGFAVVFSTLTIVVTTTEVEWWLSFRLFAQRIALADVDLVATKRLGVLSLFGVHTNGRDTSWVVSGRNAIELVRANGRRTIIGTADPGGAFAAISSVIDELGR